MNPFVAAWIQPGSLTPAQLCVAPAWGAGGVPVTL